MGESPQIRVLRLADDRVMVPESGFVPDAGEATREGLTIAYGREMLGRPLIPR